MTGRDAHWTTIENETMAAAEQQTTHRRAAARRDFGACGHLFDVWRAAACACYPFPIQAKRLMTWRFIAVVFTVSLGSLTGCRNRCAAAVAASFTFDTLKNIRCSARSASASSMPHSNPGSACPSKCCLTRPPLRRGGRRPRLPPCCWRTGLLAAGTKLLQNSSPPKPCPTACRRARPQRALCGLQQLRGCDGARRPPPKQPKLGAALVSLMDGDALVEPSCS